MLTPAVAKAVKALADKYFAATAKDIHVNSGTRTAAQQADAMYIKLAAGDALAEYINQLAVADIKKAYNDGVVSGKSAAVITDMAKVIEAQIASGVYISKHLKAGAVDIRIVGMTTADKAAFKQAVKDEGSFEDPPLEEAVPPHWHLQLRQTSASATAAPPRPQQRRPSPAGSEPLAAQGAGRREPTGHGGCRRPPRALRIGCLVRPAAAAASTLMSL
ncbi:MAG: hypothetical protein WCG47_34070 [Dermatophilaceae bacterium]